MASPDEGRRSRKERGHFAAHFARTVGDLSVLWLPHRVRRTAARERRRRVV